MTQASLFSVERRARARRNDPYTSWYATQGIDVSRSEAMTLTALVSGPGTSDEIWQRIVDRGDPITPQRVRTALSEMRKRGLTRTTGETKPSLNGGPSRVWTRA